MGQKSAIQWTDASWTPIRARVKQNAGEIAAAKGYASLIQIATKMQGHVGPHCERCSPGCGDATGGGCYSEANNGRCLPNNGTGLPFDRRARDLVDVFVDEKILAQPLRWRAPRKVFVCSQTDLFAEFVTDEMILRVLDVIRRCAYLGHTFQILTKRAERLRDICSRLRWDDSGFGRIYLADSGTLLMPLMKHAWCGVSVEDRERKSRIDILRDTPAAVRFLSLEPLLEDLGTLDLRGIGWAIIGGESGPGARPLDIAWARSIVRQCWAAEVAVFCKQLGANPWARTASGYGPGVDAYPYNIRYQLKDKKGGDPSEWPEDLQIRQFPEVAHVD